MSLSRWAIFAAFVGILSTGQAFGQNRLQQPGSIVPTAENFNYYETSQDVESPSDVVPNDVEEEYYFDDGDEDGAWTAQDWLVGPSDYGIVFRGWLEFGGTWNGDGIKTGTGNAPLQFNTQSDALMVNQIWGYAEREVDTGGDGWDLGFRFDLMFGSDGPDTQAFGDVGWDTTWASGRDYGGAVPQAYIDLGYNDLTVRMGHFYTIIGYEVVPAPDNFFYTHAHQQYYAGPLTHTGILASHPLTDQIEISAGWTQGWDTGFNNRNNADMFLGSAAWTGPDEYLNIIYAVTAGRFGDGAGGGNAGNLFMQSVVVQYDFGNGYTGVLHTDYAENSALPSGIVKWYGLSGYLLREIDEVWSWGVRMEWFRDDNGARIVGAGAGIPGDYWEVTMGLNWNPHTNLVVRPEVRYDWVRGGPTPFNSGSPLGVGVMSADLFTLSCDAILTF